MTKVRAATVADLPTAGRSPAAVASFLDRLADETGDDAFRRAARAMRQPPPGRSPIDDDAMLRRVHEFIDGGKARSMRHALTIVARDAADDGKGERAIIERLRRKAVASKNRATK
jgi:hypothetical protein